MEFLLGFFVLYLCFCIPVALLASVLGKPSVLWFLISIFISPIFAGLILLVVAASRDVTET